MSSISTAAVTDSTSSALPFAVRFTTARLPASYDQSVHDSPPYSFTPAVISVSYTHLTLPTSDLV